MKKLAFIGAIACVLTACGGSDTTDTQAGESNASTDSVGLTNPISIDTVKHPTGMENSNVISTDTAAMNTQNSINKAKAAQKK
jgi:hypothetical protein